MSTANETGNPKKSGSKIGVIIIALAILFIVALLAYRISSNNKTPEISEEPPVNVKITEAQLLSIFATTPISGRIQPIDEVVIMPLASGEVTYVYVKMGDKVNKGALLFEIDKAQMATALNQAKEGYTVAETAYNRMSALYSEGAVSLQMFEQAQTQYVTSRESYNAASNAYSNCTVKSPISGYITSLSVTAGSLAAPGAPAATVADISELKINTSVSEYLAPKLKPGDQVDIRIATLGDQKYEGIITAVSPAPATGGLTYPVSISVNDESGEVMAGMFAEISIISDEKDKVLCIPSDAVMIKSGRPVVVVIESGNMPIYKEVGTGIDNGEYVEITSGLNTGETIVTAGQQYVKEGVAVNIVE